MHLKTLINNKWFEKHSEEKFNEILKEIHSKETRT